jgi:hypothetical protein
VHRLVAIVERQTGEHEVLALGEALQCLRKTGGKRRTTIPLPRWECRLMRQSEAVDAHASTSISD